MFFLFLKLYFHLVPQLLEFIYDLFAHVEEFETMAASMVTRLVNKTFVFLAIFALFLPALSQNLYFCILLSITVWLLLKSIALTI